MPTTTSSKSTTDEALGACGYIVASIALFPLLAIWKGYVISILWRWFVVTTFDLRPLTIPAAIGLVYVVQLVAIVPRIPRKDDGRPAFEKFFSGLGTAILWPGFSLLFGAIVNHWM